MSQWQSIFPYIPSHGVIETLEVCRPECLSGRVYWRRIGDSLEVFADTEAGWLEFKSDGVSSSLLGEYSALGPSLFSATLVEGDEGDELSLTGMLNAIFNDSAFEFSAQKPVDYRLNLHAIQLEYEAVINKHSALTLAELGESSKLNVSLTTKLAWGFLTGDLALDGEQNLAFDFTHASAISNLTLVSELNAALDYPGFSAGDLSLSPGSTCRFDVTLSCELAPAAIQLDYGAMAVQAQLSRFKLQNLLEAPKASLLLNLQINDPSPLFSTQLALSFDQGNLSAESNTGELLGELPLSLNLAHNLKATEGSLDFVIDIQSVEANSLLKRFEIEDVNLTSLFLGLDGQLSWRLENQDDQSPFLQSELQVEMHELSGDFSGYQLDGGKLDVHLRGWPILESDDAAVFTLASLNVGLPITDIGADFDINLDLFEQTARLDGRVLTAKLLGGAIKSHKYAFDSLSQSGFVALELLALDLEKILDLEQQNFVSSGKISGSVPIQIDGVSLSVSGGSIYALEPGGLISYQPDARVQSIIDSNQALKVVTDIMADFRYDRLTAKIDYTQAGDFTAKTRIEGRNPDYENGRQINLNLNLEENLKTLLESLRLSDKLSRSIQDKTNSGVR